MIGLNVVLSAVHMNIGFQDQGGAYRIGAF